MDDRFIYLANLKSDNMLTESEAEEFDRLLDASDENRAYFRETLTLKETLSSMDRDFEIPGGSLAPGVMKSIRNKKRRNKTVIRILGGVAAAAAMVTVTVVGISRIDLGNASPDLAQSAPNAFISEVKGSGTEETAEVPAQASMGDAVSKPQEEMVISFTSASPDSQEGSTPGYAALMLPPSKASKFDDAVENNEFKNGMPEMGDTENTSPFEYFNEEETQGTIRVILSDTFGREDIEALLGITLEDGEEIVIPAENIDQVKGMLGEAGAEFEISEQNDSTTAYSLIIE